MWHLQWCDFYEGYLEWGDSTRRTRICSLEDIGSGYEVVEVIREIQDEKIRAQLIRKAMKLGVEITNDDFMELDGELPREVFEQLGQYAHLDYNDPYFDEDDMTWDDFYNAYFQWDDVLCARRVGKLEDFGNSDEVCDVLVEMPTMDLQNELYRKAIAAGVKFTRDELERLSEETCIIEDFESAIENSPEKLADRRRNQRITLWGVLLGLDL